MIAILTTPLVYVMFAHMHLVPISGRFTSVDVVEDEFAGKMFTSW
jgi:hypothetical protein